MTRCLSAVVRLLTAGALMVLAGSSAAQQGYPNKPIRLITPFAPGGGTSVIANLIGQKLTESWGQQILIDHRPGGNTIIGSEALVRSPPDGYTIMLQAGGHAVHLSLQPLPYDTVKDFAPVTTVTSSAYILVLHPSVPANNLQEVIALAKSKPGKLNFASAGTGGLPHMAGELFQIMTGVKFLHVPYKGSGPAIVDLIAGQVDLSFQDPLNVVTRIKAGRLKAIAVTGDSRLPALPDLPTFAEAGLPGLDIKNWYGIFAPAKTPRGIINKLSSELGRIMTTSDMKEKLANQGVEPFVSSPEQFSALIKADIAKYARIIKTANIKLEN